MALIALGWALWPSDQAAADTTSGWSQAAFAGAKLGLVQINPQRANEMAVVEGDTLQLSQTEGVVWSASSIPAVPRSIAFDPVVGEKLYAGTDRGLYVSTDFGASWSLLDSTVTALQPFIKVVAANDGVYGVVSDDATSNNKVYRFDSDGAVTDLQLPDTNAGALAYDATGARLMVGAGHALFYSDDRGASWQAASGAGTFGRAIVVKPGADWEISADGLFRSNDGGANWQELARPGELNDTNYGSDMIMSGLAVNGSQAYYGDYSFYYPYKFLAQYSGGSANGTGLNQKVFDVGNVDNQVWAATDDGLWVNGDLASAGPTKVTRPVIIIPGILGSWPVASSVADHYLLHDLEPWDHSYNSSLVLDPIQHTYDPLIQKLEADGYVKDQTLFAFPYQWRQDNNETAHQLAQKIKDVKAMCGCNKVDLVGHSMGGLVARAYIQSDYYQDDVANLVQIATPNAGAVDSYSKWEAGDLEAQTKQDKVASLYFKLEALHAGHLSLVQYIRKDVTSVDQLLPVFDYLDGRSYPEGYPRNTFLESLNQSSEIAKLKQRTTVYTIGSSSHSTESSLRVGAGDSSRENWPDGEIQAKHYAAGDGTVLLSSLESVAKASFLLSGDHGGVVSQSDSFIAQNLLAAYVAPAEAAPQSDVQKYLMLYVKSPVKMAVIDTDGNQVDDEHLDIPGAYYTGSDHDTQFVLIPDPISQNFSITLTGTDNASYGVGADEISDDQPDLDTELGGQTTVGQEHHYVYNAINHTFTSLDPNDTTAGTSSAIAGVAPNSTGRDQNQSLVSGGSRLDNGVISLAAQQNFRVAKSAGLRANIDRVRASVGAWRANTLALMLGIGILLVLWLQYRRNQYIEF